jgi:hypothetical protein
MSAPFDRTAAIARVGFLMPGLTDRGLAWLLGHAEDMARAFPRDLTPATLADEQRAREADPPPDPPPCEWCKVGEALVDACRRDGEGPWAGWN